MLNCAFSPKMGAKELILNIINKSKYSIYMATYSFTCKDVADALINAFKRGVVIYVVSDEQENIKTRSVVKYLAENGINIRLNTRYAILHHKFMIIDGTDIQTGSYNYSASAHLRNAENVIHITNTTEMVDSFKVQWDRMWNEGYSYSPLTKFQRIKKTIFNKIKNVITKK